MSGNEDVKTSNRMVNFHVNTRRKPWKRRNEPNDAKVQNRSRKREIAGMSRVRETAPTELQNLHPRFKSGRRLQFFLIKTRARSGPSEKNRRLVTVVGSCIAFIEGLILEHFSEAMKNYAEEKRLKIEAAYQQPNTDDRYA